MGKDEPTDMKKVLILGDSISMGYRDYVKELLQGKAEVRFSEENGRYAKYTLHMVNQWIRNISTPDIVHWNNGIWDISVEPPLEGNFTPLPEYLYTLERIIQTLQTAGAGKIIFATTTYQSPKFANTTQADIDLYNQAACALMLRKGIEVNDLGAFVKPRVSEFVCDDLLHLNEAGYRACAAQVAAVIEKFL